MALSTIQNNSFADTAVHGRRNLIINGAMQVAQRGDVTGATSNVYGGPDRFRLQSTAVGAFTISQSSIAPEGFSTSYRLDCTTADTPLAAGDLLRFQQFVEAQNLQQLSYGLSSAKTITLSFYVRSNKTGTYSLQFQQANNGYKQAVFSYTINSADTWERKIISVAGDTAGIINNDNSAGLVISWVLGAGSDYTSGSERPTYTTYANGDVASSQTVNLADSTSNYWQITGVQLELGSQATPFEHRSYAEELSLCQRYLKLGGAGVYGIYNSAANIEISIPLNPNMRAAPTLSMAKTTVTISNKTNSNTATATSVSAVNISSSPSGVYFAQIGNCNVTSASAGHIAQFRTDEFLQLDAEL